MNRIQTKKYLKLRGIKRFNQIAGDISKKHFEALMKRLNKQGCKNKS